MRILHVITTLDGGGAERLLVDLLPSLQRKGYEVNLLLFNGVETPFKKELIKDNIQIHDLSKGRSVYDKNAIYSPLNVFKLIKYLKHFDVIHTHNSICQLYVPIAKLLCNTKAKLVTTEHSATNRRRSIKAFKPLDRWMYDRYDAIICIAEQTRENLETYIGVKPTIHTIYNGVDVSSFLNPIKDIDSHERVMITMVAAFRKEKDHETTLRAMMHLPENYFLQFVGRGELEPQVQERCKELGLDNRVTFMGLRTDIPAILEESDIVLLSSHWEGLSLSSIEGMASGRPFIASDVDGLHEMVSGAGVLFPHGDDKALAKAIQELCENPGYYRKVAQACQERAKKYDISVMAEGYLKLYESLMENNN